MLMLELCLSSQATYVGVVGQPWAGTPRAVEHRVQAVECMRCGGKARVQQVGALALIITGSNLFQDKSTGTHVFIK